MRLLRITADGTDSACSANYRPNLTRSILSNFLWNKYINLTETGKCDNMEADKSNQKGGENFDI